MAEAKEKAPPPSLLHKDTEDTPKVSSSRWRRPRGDTCRRTQMILRMFFLMAEACPPA
jgi:hypothetical protein